MFGHVQANRTDLTDEELTRYREFYCGLCHRLGEKFGFHSRISLTYDLTFLALLLASLYEPDEVQYKSRCIVHPGRKHSAIRCECIDYAADMTVALTYFKCLDDWEDDRNLPERCYAQLLKKAYKKVEERWPHQTEVIEKELKVLKAAESSMQPVPDDAADSFGRLMSAIFSYKDDFWHESLEKMGFSLGKYIYMADAAVDYEDDKKHGQYNPFNYLESTPEKFRPVLEIFLGEVSENFERLPLVQDINILRNILYSGIWIKYNIEMNKHREDAEK